VQNVTKKPNKRRFQNFKIVQINCYHIFSEKFTVHSNLSHHDKCVVDFLEQDFNRRMNIIPTLIPKPVGHPLFIKAPCALSTIFPDRRGMAPLAGAIILWIKKLSEEMSVFGT